MVIVGTPEECLKKLLRYEAAGVDQLLCYLNFGYLPHEAIMRSIELLGTYVIPALQKLGKHGLAAGLQQSVAEAERSVTAQKWLPTPESPTFAQA
jgi:hypothetical protein